MMKPDDRTLTDLLAALGAGGMPRIWALDDLACAPAGDPRVALAIAAALADPTACRVEQSFLGEVRLLAALALLAERAALGDLAPVRLCCVPPIGVGDLMDLLEDARLPWPEPREDVDDAGVAAFALARDYGLLSERELDLGFPVNIAALAAAWAPQVAPVETSEPPGGTYGADGGAAPTAPAPGASEDDVQFLLGILAQGSRDDQAIALRNLSSFPTGDPRLRAALVPLLDDSTPCLLQIPYRFGELRLLAATALAAERRTIGDQRPVSIRSVLPQSPDDLERRREQAGVPRPAEDNPVESDLRLFAALATRGLLPIRNFALGERGGQ